jgi:hypothetical protein
MTGSPERLRKSLHILVGYLGGCVVAALAVSIAGYWAWSLPVALAGAAVVWE